MIAYNHTSLDNLIINEEVQTALQHELLSKEEAAGIESKYPVNLYTPNLFIRIGMFLLTAVITLMGYGLFCLMLLHGSESQIKVMTIIYGVLVYGGLEFIVYDKKHFRSGIDDALMIFSLGFILTGINLLSHSISYLGQSILIFVPTFYYLLRFGNVLMGGIAYLSFLGIVFFGFMRLGEMARYAMPFLLMVFSLIVYWFIKKSKKSQRLRHYKACFTFIEILALVMLYVAGNYFVVREVSNSMFDLQLKEGEAIPGAWIFWVFTILLPLVYIFKGLQKKDVIVLRTGLIMIAAIVFTVRYYHHVAPLEVAMSIGGIIMILLAYYLTKYLTPPRYGFTHAEPNDPKLNGLLNLESLVVTQTFNQSTPVEPEQGFDFGGGSAGGAGTTDRW
ncbi:MAG TPA: hypothetical protein VM187_02575 [Niastella sp.]|nr:hypothetical protein [Niastella sp.]